MRLTYRQLRVLEACTDEWAALPHSIGCTNSTLKALETRGIVETRIEPGTHHRAFAGWQWRRVPKEPTA